MDATGSPASVEECSEAVSLANPVKILCGGVQSQPWCRKMSMQCAPGPCLSPAWPVPTSCRGMSIRLGTRQEVAGAQHARAGGPDGLHAGVSIRPGTHQEVAGVQHARAGGPDGLQAAAGQALGDGGPGADSRFALLIGAGARREQPAQVVCGEAVLPRVLLRARCAKLGSAARWCWCTSRTASPGRPWRSRAAARTPAQGRAKLGSGTPIWAWHILLKAMPPRSSVQRRHVGRNHAGAAGAEQQLLSETGGVLGL